MPKTLYLLDAMALAYRSHFIFSGRPLLNSQGQNTSATYGFTSALLKLIATHGIQHLAVVFDAAGDRGTFRSELYEDYKAHRPPMPADLAMNLPWIEEVVEAFDVPCVKAPGVEADDAIGALARRAEAEGASVVIVSPDKDFRQLLSDRISIFRPAHRGEEFDLMTDAKFREEYGLEPIQFIDVLALMGDTSDNVPGVPGIGEKTAIALVQEYGSVENLLEHAAEVKGKKAREGLLEHADAARLSKTLVTIHTDVEVDLDWERLEVGTHDFEAVRAVFDRLEFRSLMRRFEELQAARAAGGTGADLFAPRRASGDGASGVPDYGDDPSMSFDFGPFESVTGLDEEKVDYRIVRTRAELETLAADLKGQALVSIDTETTSTDPMLAGLVGLSFSWAEFQGVYVPVPLPDGTSEPDLLAVLRPFYEGETRKVGQNLKYDLLVLARAGVAVGGPLFDTLVAHYLIAPEEEHSLDALARKYLSYRTIPITDLIGTGRNQITMRDVPIEKAGPYACEDADVTLRLYGVLGPLLEEQPGLKEIAETIEFPLVRVLVAMEKAGIRVDTGMLKEISRTLAAEILRLEGEIHAAAGRTFQIGSTQQLGEVLFKDLGLRVVEKTGGGKPSTREHVLLELATEHPLPGLVLDWRRLTKLKSTYVDALGALIHPKTGRVHTSFNQTIAATGRLSSSNPNLQNIPVRSEQGREIRKAFVAEEGCVLLSADYVQIELRILAAMSGDEALIASFRAGEDIHTAAAARVYGVPVEAVTRDQRSRAKQVNYGIPYGISAFGLAQRLRSSTKEAAALIDNYTKSYPRVMGFLAEVVERARELGYVETLLGRRRYVPAIRAGNRNERAFAERVAVNMPVQGTQADMIKRAMVTLHRRLRDESFGARMLLQVHDELVLEVPEGEVEAVRAIVQEEMARALPLPHGVPVEVETGVGPNWLDAH
jgi:DNA polymerase I